MRVTTLFRKLLGVTGLVADDVEIEDEGVMVDVSPSWRLPRCGQCGRVGPTYDTCESRTWRHLGLGVAARAG